MAARADTLRRALAHASDALLSAVLAPRCAACGRPLASPTSGPVCASCWNGVRALIPPLCAACGDPLASSRAALESRRCPACRRRPALVDTARSAGDYEGALRAIVHAFKYQRRRSLAGPLARLMAHAGGDVLREAACAVPVPLHPWRRLRRGFNQASDLAGGLGLPVVHALWRGRMTAAQAGLTSAGRRRNVEGAFRLSPFLTRRTRDDYITGKAVVLVDDVRTTGSTLEACARVLKEAGAGEVRALTAARVTPRTSVRGRRPSADR